jgi:TPR repeat protein
MDNAAATCWLAVMQDHGFNFTPIDKTGVRLRLRSAAEGGYAPAQALMGMDYLTGDIDLAKDDSVGRRLLGAALPKLGPLAESGDALAQFCLGAMSDDGLGVPKDAVEAARRYRLAADQGLAVAQNNLGLMHEEGRAGVKDLAEAEKCYRRAAEQGSAAAQFNLAALLERRGSQREEAIAWLRRAAIQGHAESRAELRRRRIDP